MCNYLSILPWINGQDTESSSEGTECPSRTAPATNAPSPENELKRREAPI